MHVPLIITPEMIEAGVAELREKALGESLERIVSDVFRAMVCASSLEPPLHQPSPRGR